MAMNLEPKELEVMTGIEEKTNELNELLRVAAELGIVVSFDLNIARIYGNPAETMIMVPKFNAVLSRRINLK